LFSRIQQRKKQDKLNQYRGDGMERFSEELKQIVRISCGKWHKESNYAALYMGKEVTWHNMEGVISGNCQFICQRPEFERCLMQMTGRPKVESWNNNTHEIRYTANGEWLSYDAYRQENVFYGQGEKMDGFCIIMSREEALERERIAFGGEKKAPIKPGQSMKEAYEENFGDTDSGESIDKMKPIKITLNQIKETGNKQLLKNMLAYCGKSTADDDQFNMSDIIKSEPGVKGCIYTFRALPEYSDIWKRFAWWCACQVAHLSNDDRVSECLKVTIDYIDGKATRDELIKARSAAAAYAAAAYAAADAAAAAAYAADARENTRAAQAEKLASILDAGEWVDDGVKQAEADIAGLTVVAEGSIGDLSIDQNTINVEVVESDWFRNGDMPPVGAELVVLYHEDYSRFNSFNGKVVTVLGVSKGGGDNVVTFRNDLEGLGCLIYSRDKKGFTGCLYPAGFDIEQVHVDAIAEDVLFNAAKSSELSKLISEAMEGDEFFDADILAGKLLGKVAVL